MDSLDIPPDNLYPKIVFFLMGGGEAVQGDFETFYLRHFKAIYRVCYAFMKNAPDAEDCTEDAFVKAMTCDVAFENERHKRAWLTTTAMNICKDKLKHWWRQKVTGMDDIKGIV